MPQPGSWMSQFSKGEATPSWLPAWEGRQRVGAWELQNNWAAVSSRSRRPLPTSLRMDSWPPHLKFCSGETTYSRQPGGGACDRWFLIMWTTDTVFAFSSTYRCFILHRRRQWGTMGSPGWFSRVGIFSYTGLITQSCQHRQGLSFPWWAPSGFEHLSEPRMLFLEETLSSL